MSILKQSFWGIAIKAFSIVSGFFVVTVLARVLSPSVYGVYSVVLATVTILAIPTALGLPSYLVRETAQAMVDKDGFHVRRIVRAAVKLVLLVATLVVVAALTWQIVGTDSLVNVGNQSNRFVLWLGLGLLPAMALIQVTGAALRGIGNSTFGMLVSLILRNFLFLTLLICWLLLVKDLTAISAMALHLVAAGLALCFGGVAWILLRPVPSQPPQGSDREFSVRTMLTSTGVMGIIAGAQTLNANLDVVMLGLLSSAEVAGIYKLASTIALLTVAGLQAINMVFMPVFARIYREGDTLVLQKLATRSVRLIVLTALPISVTLIAFGQSLINIAFGAEYSASYAPMVILVVGQLMSVMFGSVITILNMTGHEIDAMKGALLGCIVNVILNAALIPMYGAYGAAFATASTVVAWNVYLHILVRKRLSINSLPFRFLNVAS